jgi:hypothetical protein
MAMQTLRSGARELREPSLYELEPIRHDGRTIAISLSVRLAEDAVWRGRLEFHEPESSCQRATAEIFCGESEEELWQSVRALRDHHFRDLYRSLL